MIAKWAQTRDGKLAMADGSRWISNERSREVVQQLRGRVDAIIVGSGTARADDPLLTARPKNPADVKRKALRVVVDSKAIAVAGEPARENGPRSARAGRRGGRRTGRCREGARGRGRRRFSSATARRTPNGSNRCSTNSAGAG